MQEVIQNVVESSVLESTASFFGLPTAVLMENAGRETARFVAEKYGGRKRVAVFCGTGNNGGDGFAAARWLALERHWPTVFLVGSPQEIRSPQASSQWRALENAGNVKKVVLRDSKELERLNLGKFDVVLDCLLGIGQSGDLREPIRSAVQKINSMACPCVAVDVPTGFGTSVAVKADVTLSFSLPKTRAAKVVGIGIPPEFAFLAGPGHVRALSLPADGSHKGENGVLLVIGGSRQFHGAPINSIKVASRFVDLVYFSSARENGKLLQQMKIASTDFIAFRPKEIGKAVEKSDCILIGPGLEPDAAAKKLVNNLLRKFKHKKFVLDAGALRVVEKQLLSPSVCVTPHAGEFKALFGLDASQEACGQMAKGHGCFIALKGPVDFIGFPGGRVIRDYQGNAGMTKGGVGDVLAGLLAAFACKNGFEIAAPAAVFSVGFAANFLYDRRGATYSATDLVTELPSAVHLAREL